MSAKEHNKIIGILHLVEGGLGMFGAIILALGIFGFGFYIQSSQTIENAETIVKILFIAGLILVPISFLMAFINLFAGWKILKEKSGARKWGIVASIISLINIPLGTIIGAYSLWFLFGVEGKEIYPSDTK